MPPKKKKKTSPKKTLICSCSLSETLFSARQTESNTITIPSAEPWTIEKIESAIRAKHESRQNFQPHKPRTLFLVVKATEENLDALIGHGAAAVFVLNKEKSEPTEDAASSSGAGAAASSEGTTTSSSTAPTSTFRPSQQIVGDNATAIMVNNLSQNLLGQPFGDAVAGVRIDERGAVEGLFQSLGKLFLSGSATVSFLLFRCTHSRCKCRVSRATRSWQTGWKMWTEKLKSQKLPLPQQTF